MAIVLIVEDGSGVAGANTYATANQAINYAASRGITLVDNDELASQLIVAADYIGSKELQYQGDRSFPIAQSLSWPRIGAIIYTLEISPTSIPTNIVQAQCQLVIEQVNGENLFVNTNNSVFVTEETVDVITTKFQRVSSETGSNAPVFGKVDALLAPLLKSTIYGFRTVRV